MSAKSRIAALFAKKKQEGKKVLVAYLCVGDPSLDESIALARACLAAGADMLELGVPFSDPTADGPAIARASQRAIAKGGGLAATLEVARALRAENATAPIVLFGYYNPIFVRGDARVAREAYEAGVDAFLIVDLPLEEGAELRTEAASRGLSLRAAPRPDQLERSRGGPAGRVREMADGLPLLRLGDGRHRHRGRARGRGGRECRAVGRELGLPVVVGFGIDSREKARAASEEADGVVVGTALVRAIEDAKTPEARARAVTELITELRAGLDG